MYFIRTNIPWAISVQTSFLAAQAWAAGSLLYQQGMRDLDTAFEDLAMDRRFPVHQLMDKDISHHDKVMMVNNLLTVFSKGIKYAASL